MGRRLGGPCISMRVHVIDTDLSDRSGKECKGRDLICRSFLLQTVGCSANQTMVSVSFSSHLSLGFPPPQVSESLDIMIPPESQRWKDDRNHPAHSNSMNEEVGSL